jgi:hypothetical protein
VTNRRLAILLAAVLVVGVVAGFALQRSNTPELAPGRGPAQDPLAYNQDKGPREDLRLEARAAAGLSHVLYAKSPGGATATAARTARFRPLIDAAAARHGVDADTLEAIVFLESAGRPEAQASSDLSSAVGLTQILAQTGSGLLHMHVDLPRSRELTKKLAKAIRKHKPGLAAKLRKQRRKADERFDPKKSLDATGRYLTFAKPLLGGRSDLAVESYHMGVGNLQSVLAAYGAKPAETSYAQLYFGSTPRAARRSTRRRTTSPGRARTASCDRCRRTPRTCTCASTGGWARSRRSSTASARSTARCGPTRSPCSSTSPRASTRSAGRDRSR